MTISSKGRYALAAAVHMASNYDSGENLTVISISEKLGISKIYLEQVFSLLKRGGLANSAKGSQGGYQLARMPRQITAFDVLSAAELSLFEKVENSVSGKAPEIDAAMHSLVFEALDQAITKTLKDTTLEDLVQMVEQKKSGNELMFYI